jgi:hypothetical protein
LSHEALPIPWARGSSARLQAGQLHAGVRPGAAEAHRVRVAGYRSAIVQLPQRVRIHGTIAGLAWLALQLIILLGGRNRLWSTCPGATSPSGAAASSATTGLPSQPS